MLQTQLLATLVTKFIFLSYKLLLFEASITQEKPKFASFLFMNFWREFVSVKNANVVSIFFFNHYQYSWNSVEDRGLLFPQFLQRFWIQIETFSSNVNVSFFFTRKEFQKIINDSPDSRIVTWIWIVILYKCQNTICLFLCAAFNLKKKNVISSQHYRERFLQCYSLPRFVI